MSPAVRRKQRCADAIPPDLAEYDPERWERYAAGHPIESVGRPQLIMWKPHDHYEAALRNAGVADDLVHHLRAKAVVVTIRRRLTGEAS